MAIYPTDIIKLFDDWDVFGDKAIYSFIIQKRWPEGIACPFCGSKKIYTLNNKHHPFKCAERGCRKKFSYTSGTILANTKLSFPTIFAHAHQILTNNFKSSVESAAELACSQKTSYYLIRKIKQHCVGGAFYPFG